MKNSKILIPLSIAWACLMAGTVFGLARHDATPGVTADCKQINLHLSNTVTPARFSLLMFLHPHCPCSAASIAELAQLMSRCGSQLHATVLFYQPAGFSTDWFHSSTWNTVSAIPGVEVRPDLDGKLAKQLGAQTSGQLFLSDQTGRVAFEGGITGSRGHVGDNDSLNLLTALILAPNSTPQTVIRPTYGCQIYSDFHDPISPPQLQANR